MRESTRRHLEDLDAVEWFRIVGQQERNDVIVLNSWSEAITQCLSQEWEDMQLDASNALSRYLSIHAKERYRQWNAIADDVDLFIKPLIQRKTQAVNQAIHPPQSFISSIYGDILGFAREVEYADLRPPSFYADVYGWYMSGHFPCGYCGQYPDGKFVIY